MPGTREPVGTVEPWTRGAVLPMGPVDGAPRSRTATRRINSTLTLFAPIIILLEVAT